MILSVHLFVNFPFLLFCHKKVLLILLEVNSTALIKLHCKKEISLFIFISSGHAINQFITVIFLSRYVADGLDFIGL